MWQAQRPARANFRRRGFRRAGADTYVCAVVPRTGGWARTPFNPLAREVCLVRGDPGVIVCHNATAFIEVEDAAGRGISAAVDEIKANGSSFGEPSSLTVAGAEGVLLPDVRGQMSMRVALFVHEDRLYELSSILPDSADPTSVRGTGSRSRRTGRRSGRTCTS